MEAHQQRVVDEHADLNDKITKLYAFMETDLFKSLDPDERNDLEKQSNYMMGYWTTLGRRIQRFSQ